MGQIALQNPVVVYTDDDDEVVLIAADGINDPMTPAQTWEPGEGYSEVKPLGVWLKFLYYLEEVNPPTPWVEPT